MDSVVERYIAKFPKSRELSQQAKSIFSRGVTHDSRIIFPFPIFIAHAQGSHEWDVEGNEYVDYCGGHGALILGHAHPSFVKAVNDQVFKGVHPGAEHELCIEWARLIMKLIPSAERIEFTNSGTEGNMLAMRLARAFTGRNKIIKFRGHFLGWHDQMMVGLKEPWDVPVSSGLIAGELKNTIVLPVNDEAALENALLTRDVALLMVEANGDHAGVTGIHPAFYQVMRELTEKYGTLLHFDEVVTGFRYSPGGVQTAVGIIPDLTTLGKIVTGGIPGAGAVVGRAVVMDMLRYEEDDAEWNRYKRVAHFGTFNANPLCAAVGVATLKILATGEHQKQANKMAAMMHKGMQRVLDKRGVAGCVYGDMSNYHIYFGRCELRDKCDNKICLNSSKIRPARVGEILSLNLAINGVHTFVRGIDGLLSVHNETDINKTVEAFDISLDAMIAEGVIKGNLGTYA
jgi:glutamate-1-semialdehyde 2,1-aminomutase